MYAEADHETTGKVVYQFGYSQGSFYDPRAIDVGDDKPETLRRIAESSFDVFRDYPALFRRVMGVRSAELWCDTVELDIRFSKDNQLNGSAEKKEGDDHANVGLVRLNVLSGTTDEDADRVVRHELTHHFIQAMVQAGGYCAKTLEKQQPHKLFELLCHSVAHYDEINKDDLYLGGISSIEESETDKGQEIKISYINHGERRVVYRSDNQLQFERDSARMGCSILKWYIEDGKLSINVLLPFFAQNRVVVIKGADGAPGKPVRRYMKYLSAAAMAWRGRAIYVDVEKSINPNGKEYSGGDKYISLMSHDEQQRRGNGALSADMVWDPCKDTERTAAADLWWPRLEFQGLVSDDEESSWRDLFKSLKRGDGKESQSQLALVHGQLDHEAVWKLVDRAASEPVACVAVKGPSDDQALRWIAGAYARWAHEHGETEYRPRDLRFRWLEWRSEDLIECLDGAPGEDMGPGTAIDGTSLRHPAYIVLSMLDPDKPPSPARGLAEARTSSGSRPWPELLFHGISDEARGEWGRLLETLRGEGGAGAEHGGTIIVCKMDTRGDARHVFELIAEHSSASVALQATHAHDVDPDWIKGAYQSWVQNLGDKAQDETKYYTALKRFRDSGSSLRWYRWRPQDLSSDLRSSEAAATLPLSSPRCILSSLAGPAEVRVPR